MNAVGNLIVTGEALELFGWLGMLPWKNEMMTILHWKMELLHQKKVKECTQKLED